MESVWKGNSFLTKKQKKRLLPLLLLLFSINAYFNLSLLTCFYYEFCSSGLPVPKGNHFICISNYLQIPPQWCAAAILLILRQEFGQLQAFFTPKGRYFSRFSTVRFLEPIIAIFITITSMLKFSILSLSILSSLYLKIVLKYT